MLSPHLVSVAQAPLSRLNLDRSFTPRSFARSLSASIALAVAIARALSLSSLSLAPAPALAIALALALNGVVSVSCVVAQAHVVLAHKGALLFQRRTYYRQRELVTY